MCWYLVAKYVKSQLISTEKGSGTCSTNSLIAFRLILSKIFFFPIGAKTKQAKQAAHTLVRSTMLIIDDKVARTDKKSPLRTDDSLCCIGNTKHHKASDQIFFGFEDE